MLHLNLRVGPKSMSRFEFTFHEKKGGKVGPVNLIVLYEKHNK